MGHLIGSEVPAMCIREAAQSIGIKERAFVAWLIALRWLSRHGGELSSYGNGSQCWLCNDH